MYTLVHSSLCILWSDKTYTTQFATAGPARYTYLHIYWRISTYLQNIYSYWHLWIREPGCCHSEYYHSYLEHRALEHGPGELLYISQLLNRYFLQYMIIECRKHWRVNYLQCHSKCSGSNVESTWRFMSISDLHSVHYVYATSCKFTGSLCPSKYDRV